MEKYSPRSFLELLGDEEINREVLRWVKRWDRCVFGESPPGGAKSRGKAKTSKQALESRPDERILLICGAPGSASGTFRLTRRDTDWDHATLIHLKQVSVAKSSSAQSSH